MNFKKISLMSVLFFCAFLTACGGGDSSSGAQVEPSMAGSNIPANFVGTYMGTLTVRAEAAGLSETETVEITITVTSDGMLRFDGDDPDETFSVGVTNEGNFSGNLDIDEDECEGSVSTTGRVDGTRASGDIEGSGSCTVRGVTIEVDLTGTFEATKT